MFQSLEVQAETLHTSFGRACRVPVAFARRHGSTDLLKEVGLTREEP
jgi:hypothetical protein